MLTLATFSEAECHIRHHFSSLSNSSYNLFNKTHTSPLKRSTKKQLQSHMDYTPTNHHNQPSHETINIYAYTRAREMVFQGVFMFSGTSRSHFSKKRGATHDSNPLFTAILLPLPPYSCHSLQHFSLAAITEDKHITTKQQKKGVSKVFLTRPWLSFFL